MAGIAAAAAAASHVTPGQREKAIADAAAAVSLHPVFMTHAGQSLLLTCHHTGVLCNLGGCSRHIYSMASAPQQSKCYHTNSSCVTVLAMTPIPWCLSTISIVSMPASTCYGSCRRMLPIRPRKRKPAQRQHLPAQIKDPQGKHQPTALQTGLAHPQGMNSDDFRGLGFGSRPHGVLKQTSFASFP